jgi:hypothetical protein
MNSMTSTISADYIRDRHLMALYQRQARPVAMPHPVFRATMARLVVTSASLAGLLVMSMSYLDRTPVRAYVAEPDHLVSSVVKQPERLAPFAAQTPQQGFEASSTPVWIEETFQHASALDGATLQMGERQIRLAGITLPHDDVMCSTLDGRLESCARRAATRLELTTRWRAITCRYRQDGLSAHYVGDCRIGNDDLAERLQQEQDKTQRLAQLNVEEQNID